MTQKLDDVFAELDRQAPGAPLLALGQTVFWDELMKLGLIQQLKNRSFIAGVHDTDYFAKLPGGKSNQGFTPVPHNDTTTKGLWSAAAEFSALFGSETVVTRELYQHYGARFEKAARGKPKFLDEITEAWGWRGVVALGDEAPITADVPTSEVLPALLETLRWATDNTLEAIAEPERILAKERVDELFRLIDDNKDAKTLADLYERLLPALGQFVTGHEVNIRTTRTTKLLQFNRETSSLPRFDIVDAFVNPRTAKKARDAYNSALKGSEIYGLDRFMSGAIPFDLVVPGKGRGTLRIAKHAVIIMTHDPIFISLSKPLESVGDLATAIENRLGPDCTLIGKAVSLIGMLAREFVFVFHEGASSYVHLSRKFHDLMDSDGIALKLNPILRVRYHAWDALRHCYSWLRLPSPLQRPFGTEEICAPSIAARWREVQEEQELILQQLSVQKRSIDLIEYLRDTSGPSWKCLAHEYGELHNHLSDLQVKLQRLKEERQAMYSVLREAKQARVQAEIFKGQHFREFIFEKNPSSADLQERKELTEAVEAEIANVMRVKQKVREMLNEQKLLTKDPKILKIHDRRRDIEREAELKRIKLIRDAVIATQGLTRASRRPSAWWFPILCPDGGWFTETLQNAECYLEPLTRETAS